MIDLLLSLSTWAGSLFAMTMSTVLGLAVYIVAYKLISKYQTEELKDPTSSLFRVIGMLVGLMLSLAFAEVVVQLRAIENAISGFSLPWRASVPTDRRALSSCSSLCTRYSSAWCYTSFWR